MKITARELYELGIIERVIPEEEPACKETLPAIASYLDQAIKPGSWRTGETWIRRRRHSSRYERFRRF